MRGSLACLLAVYLILSTSVLAQGDVPIFDSAYLSSYGVSLVTSYPHVRDFNGGGARARSMGNAFVAVSDDVSAVSWNPAGLYRRDEPYEQPVIGLGYQSYKVDAIFRSQPWDVPGEFDYNDSFADWGLMSIIFPLRVKGHVVVGSISYTRLGDESQNTGMQVDTAIYYDLDDVLADIKRPFHYKNLQDYRSYVNALSIGFGTRFYDRWSIGLAINAYGGSSNFSILETIQWDEILVQPGNQRAVGLLKNNVYDTASYSGVFFTLGAKYSGERMDLGLVIKPPHTLKQTHDVFIDATYFLNGVEENVAGAARHNDDNVVELDQPLSIALGLAYHIRENWLFASDVEYRSFGSGMVNRRDSLELVPGGTDVEYFTEFDPHWNNSWSFRLGTEFLWNTGGTFVPMIPLRAGFGWSQIPEPNIESASYEFDETGNLMRIPTTSTASMTQFSLGTGARWNQVHLDLAWVFASYERFDNSWSGGRVSSVDNTSLSFTFTGFF